MINTDKKNSSAMSLTKVWLTGFIIALLVPVFAHRFFQNSVILSALDPVFKRRLAADGEVVRWKEEGCGYTTIGRHCEISPAEKRKDTKIIAFWGDSFLEAFQVSNADKMHSILNRKLKKESKGFQITAYGNSGYNLADYFFLIPRLEKHYPNIDSHIIVVGQLSDLNPDGIYFRSKPEFSFNDRPPHQSAPTLKKIIKKSQCGFLWPQVKRLHAMPDTIKTLRFSLGKVNLPGIEKKQVKTPPFDAWKFILRTFTTITNKKITFMYLSDTPFISNGKLIKKDPNSVLVENFAKLCSNYNVGFIDTRDIFLKEFEESRNFPVGFTNGHPWKGHLSKSGHISAAEAAFSYLKENM
ncbi:MAG: hypothetical protein ACYTFY_08900 [Planctomycetota bacterium]